LRFKFTVRKVAQGVQKDPGGNRQWCWTHNNNQNRRKRKSCARSCTFRPSIEHPANRWHPKYVHIHGTWDNDRGLVNAQDPRELVPKVLTEGQKELSVSKLPALSHTAFIITNFLAFSNTPVVSQSPYSPDSAPCDFFLFPRLKWELLGKHWESVKNIQKRVTTFLRAISVEESIFSHSKISSDPSRTLGKSRPFRLHWRTAGLRITP